MTTIASLENVQDSKDPKQDPQPSDTNREPWAYDTFGCFDDWRLCLATFFLPCYTIGRNAEALGEDGVTIGLLYGIGCVAFGAVTRWRIREEKKLMGNMISDVVLATLCPCCALIQENKQLYGSRGSHIGEKMPLNEDIQRK